MTEATALLSGVFWVFNFLGIGTQTEVARASGAGMHDEGRKAAALALVLAFALGVALALACIPALEPAARWMGARGETLVNLFREAIRRKPASHDLAPSDNGVHYIRTMCQIGG